jgi:hypothetical protein
LSELTGFADLAIVCYDGNLRWLAFGAVLINMVPPSAI